MGQVTVNVNGRAYRFDCGDGEEARLNELAAYVKGRVDSLVKEYGKVGDERLLLTAALLIADELMDARASLAAAVAAARNGASDEAPATPASPDTSEAATPAPDKVSAGSQVSAPELTGPEEVLRKAVGAAI